MSDLFTRHYDFTYGVVETMTPMIRRIVARNPSPFTFHGTGTYIVGQDSVAIIDPGPALPAHIDAMLAAVRAETVTHLLITHTHRDHSPACHAVKAATGALCYGFGPHGVGRVLRGETVEEGADVEFTPDVEIRNGDIIEGCGWSIACLHTPGHTSNHMCYHLREENVLFTGDHVMGWSTTIISPPDGDMAAYLESLRYLLRREDACYWPTHGPAIEHPKRLVSGLLDHRQQRQQQILEALNCGVRRIDKLVPRIYAELPKSMYPAAARSVLATMILLTERGSVMVDGDLSINAEFYLP